MKKTKSKGCLFFFIAFIMLFFIAQWLYYEFFNYPSIFYYSPLNDKVVTSYWREEGLYIMPYKYMEPRPPKENYLLLDLSECKALVKGVTINWYPNDNNYLKMYYSYGAGKAFIVEDKLADSIKGGIHKFITQNSWDTTQLYIPYMDENDEWFFPKYTSFSSENVIYTNDDIEQLIQYFKKNEKKYKSILNEYENKTLPSINK